MKVIIDTKKHRVRCNKDISKVKPSELVEIIFASSVFASKSISNVYTIEEAEALRITLHDVIDKAFYPPEISSKLINERNFNSVFSEE